MSFISLLVGFSIEYFIILRNQFLSLFIKRPPQAWASGEKGTVVLLPGFSETWFFLRPLGNFVNSLGYRVMVIGELGHNLCNLEDSAEIVKAFCGRHRLTDIIFLCHSKGGITSTMLLHDKTFSSRVKLAFNLATPYGGTVFGFLTLFNLGQLTSESMLLRGFKQRQPENSKIINLYAQLDNHVIPNRNLTIDGAHNIKIDMIGHERIVGTKETREVVRKYLE